MDGTAQSSGGSESPKPHAAVRPRSPRRLPLSRKILFGTAATVFFFGLVEGGLRVLGIKPPTPEDPPLVFAGADFKGRFPLTWDDEVFWRLGKGALIPDLDGERLSEDGFRGPRLQVPKPKGARRMVVLGDSNAFGIGIPGDATFAHRLGRWLKTSTAARWDVLNAGVPGYSAWQMRRWFEVEGTGYGADAVAVYAGAWNDYSPAVGVGDEANAAKLRDSRSWLDALRLYQLMKAAAPADAGDREASETLRQEIIKEYSERGVRRFGPRLDPGAFREALEGLARAVESTGARMIFIVPAAPKSTRERFADGEVYAGVVRAVAGTGGRGIFDARTVLGAAGDDTKGLWADFIHPGVEGHQIIALGLAAELRRLGAPDLPPPYASNENLAGIRLRDVARGVSLVCGDPPRGADARAVMALNPEVLAVPCPSTLRFEDLRIPHQASLLLYLTHEVPAGTLEDSGHQVRFEVRAGAAGQPERTLLSERMDPAGRPTNRPVHRAVDLAEFQEQRITLTLEVSGAVRYAIWGPGEIHALR